MVVLVPNPGQDNWLEKLNEWADRARVRVNWEHSSVRKGGKWHWTSIPEIAGHTHVDCAGEGDSQKEAMKYAAQHLSAKGRLW